MRLYLEPVVFYFQHSTNETSILPKMIFEKTKEKVIELATSSLTPLQYLGSIHESFVTRKIDRQTHSDYLSRYSELERNLKSSMDYIYPTKGIMSIALSYSLDRDVNHERAIHMATAKASKCDTYIMIDQNKDINKKEWQKDFEMFDLSEQEDRDSALDKINQL